MTPQKEYTWDDLVAAIGQDFSGEDVRTAADAVERGSIRLFCEPLEMDCPLHHDDEVARQHGYEGIIAPASSINQTLCARAMWKPGDPTIWPTPERNFRYSGTPGSSTAPPLPKPKTTVDLATDIEIEYFDPVYVGDTLTTKGRKLVSVNVRETSIGAGAFIVTESEVYNQLGELVARQRYGSFPHNPRPRQ